MPKKTSEISAFSSIALDTVFNIHVYFSRWILGWDSRLAENESRFNLLQCFWSDSKLCSFLTKRKSQPCFQESHFEWIFELKLSNPMVAMYDFVCLQQILNFAFRTLSPLMLFNVPRHMTARGSRVGHKQQREKSQIKHSKCFCSPKDPFSCQEQFMFGQQWKLYLFYHSAKCRLCWANFYPSKTPLFRLTV